MDNEVTYIIALMGAYSLLCFRRGASILENAICVIPSFPAEKRISEIELTEKGDIERAKYPNNWDDLDWQVYYSMKKNPNLSFGKVGGNLGVSWTTIQIHFKKILKDIDIWVSFYPKGYGYYQQALLKFKRGSPLVRWALIQVAQVAVNNDSHWKKKFERISARKGKQKAYVAIARELVVTIYHMLTNNEPYRYGREETYTRKLKSLDRLVRKAQTNQGEVLGECFSS